MIDLKIKNKDIIETRSWSKNKVLCIVQARMGSKRFPGKVLKYIDKKRSVLQFLIERLSKSKLIDQLVISCSDNAKDKKIIDFCMKSNISNLGCDIVDLVYVLYRCSKETSYRRKDG